jgi:Tfp pilus assembly protein FimT
LEFLLLSVAHWLQSDQRLNVRSDNTTQKALILVMTMIAFAIIGLLAALAIPGFVKARNQSQGRRIINDAHRMDAAIVNGLLRTPRRTAILWTPPVRPRI